MTRSLAWLLACASLAGCAAPSPAVIGAQAPRCTALEDPPRDEAHPAINRSLRIPSHGNEMNAVFLLAAGAGPKPTLLLLHGLPGHERNLDLAQAVRRSGWHVLTFTYRGAWGSTGDFSIANAAEDVSAALAFLRTGDVAAEYGVDVNRIVLAGHSMGAFAAALTVANGEHRLAGLVLVDAWNAGVTREQIAAAGAAGRAALIAGVDLGHSLHGATGDSLADELLSHADWNLLDHAGRLTGAPVLTIYASEGFGSINRELAAALQRQKGSRIQAVEMQTDHNFADHRIALGCAVVRWLEPIARAQH